MSPDRQRLAEDIFLAAVARPESERSALIHARCHGDAELLAEVHSLLGNHHGAPSGFLDGPNSDLMAQLAAVSAPGADAPTLDAPLPIGTRISGYTLSSVLGAGGMGIVYVAEQERPRRTVALKLIRRGLGTSGLIRRFEHEAEILGRLQHPGIAQIFEAGVADLPGARQPFIAMELVNGRALTEHCELYKLGTRDRLGLIAKIADAIHHAHQRGVIHRDLKPANILVDETGEPKILDFGVARISGHQFTALGLTSQHTGIGQIIGTLPFMSPEQVSGDPGDIDLRSDVYSLGVITYLILTGRLPHDLGSRSIPDAARIIREEEPARLSTINRTLRGDVDTIVAMAIAKDRTRRYQSAKDFADDLRRFLSGEPVQARRDSALYILRKQMRRYRTLVAAGAIALISLAGFLAYAIVQVGEKSRLIAVADQRAEDLRRSLYASNIAFAQASYLSNNVGRMRRVLDECPPDLCGWEWRYLHRLSDPSAFSFQAFERGWATVAVSPSTGAIVTSPVQGPARYWSLPAQRGGGEPLSIQNTPQVASIDISFAGDRVFIVDVAGHTRLLALPVLNELWSGVTFVGASARPVFSHDGSRIAHANASQIELIDASTGKVFRTLDTAFKSVTSIRFDHTGERLAVAARDGSVAIWSVATTETPPLPIRGHTDCAFGLAFSPDNRWLATASMDRTVRTFDAATGAPALVIRSHENKVFCADFTPDGRLLASGGTEGVVHVHDASTGAMVQRLHGHPDRLIALRFLSDGRLMTCGVEGVIRIWDNVGQSDVPTITIPGNVPTAAVSGDGRVVAACDSDGHIRRMELPAGVIRDQWQTQVDAATVRIQTDAAGQRIFLLLGDSIGIFEAGKAEPGRIAVPNDQVSRAVVSPDGRLLATTGRPGIVRIFDIESGRQLSEFPPSASDAAREQYAIAWSSDSTRIATCGYSDVSVYRVDRSEPPRRSINVGTQFYTIALTPDGRHAATAGEDGAIHIFDLQPPTPRETRRLLGHSGAIFALAISPDGTRIISGGFDNTARLWDFDTGLELLSLRAHTFSLCSMGFSADGNRIVTVGHDCTIRLWEAPASEPGPGSRGTPDASRLIPGRTP